VSAAASPPAAHARADGSSEALAPAYPLSALVGQDDLIEALLVCAVNPAVGGVLVRGERGTAKSTAVRALAPMLADGAGAEQDTTPTGARGTSCSRPQPAAGAAPLVEVPLGATLDRLVGSIDVHAALEGRHRASTGLLAQADGGVLYVDEVNLLGDHLVDALLDAAADGRVRVERDGISVVQPARFLLVGTMNPEEGELRPQLLDRFGLGVEVAGPRDPAVRAEIVRRRMAFDADPAGFARAWAAAETTLAARLAAAREHLATVRLPGAMLERITATCVQLDLDGVRGDLTCAQAALALAALDGAEAVRSEHVARAAHLALRHRLRRDPLAPPPPPGGGDPAIDDALEQADRETTPTNQHEAASESQALSESQAPSEAQRPSEGPASASAPAAGASADSPALQPGRAAGRAARPRAVDARIPDDALSLRGTRPARDRRRVTVTAPAGRAPRGTLAVVDARPAQPQEPAAALPTLLAALRGDTRPHAAITGGGRGANLLLIIDASGSMAAQRRLARVKGAVEAALRLSYARRDRVAVVSFAGTGARTLVAPGMPIEQAAAAIAGLPAGGRTPIAEGLEHARELLQPADGRASLVLLLTDGRAADPGGRAARALERIAREADRAVVVDLEEGPVRLGLAAELAARAGADLTRLITSDQITPSRRAA
jgi:magnesium chelatase subunit D